MEKPFSRELEAAEAAVTTLVIESLSQVEEGNVLEAW